MQTSTKPLTLTEFLTIPETKPASEYISGKIVQKPMPKARHSRLQSKLTQVINDISEAAKLAYAFPELRCTFGGRSIVPDVSVLYWKNIPFNQQGEPQDDVLMAPDWTIEILSPDQSPNQVTGNILHCLQHGCQLGWLLDPNDRSVLMFQPKQQPELRYGPDSLLVLDSIDLILTVDQVFDWLKMAE
jgi:Uma2 family endonuclease